MVENIESKCFRYLKRGTGLMSDHQEMQRAIADVRS